MNDFPRQNPAYRPTHFLSGKFACEFSLERQIRPAMALCDLGAVLTRQSRVWLRFRQIQAAGRRYS